MSVERGTLFGRLLWSYRLAAGLTQQVLAERAGISLRAVRALERGQSRPQKESAQRLANALGLQHEERQQFMAAAPPAPRRSNRPVEQSKPSFSPATAGLPGSAQPDIDRTVPALNLPVPPTPLIGRETEAAAVGQLLHRADTRLVTLLGPGGVGKTRLALQLAAQAQPYFSDGVFFVALEALDRAPLLPATIAATLGLREFGNRPLGTMLASYLSPRQMLLVLDNFEHLADAAPQVAELQKTAPRLKILTTSRVPLRLQGEHLFPLAPLALPGAADTPSGEDVGRWAAVRLFVQRATMVHPAFRFSDDNAVAVAEITRRLDGLPLAIELAAAHTALLPPQLLLQQLSRPLNVLTGGACDLPPRQQSLGSTIAWSYDLLAAPQQALFRCLAVCVGGCTLEAAKAIGQYDDMPGATGVFSGLVKLAEANLLLTEATGTGEPRFTMLATVREYGLAQLEKVGETGLARERHADYYLRFAADAIPGLRGERQVDVLDLLDRELPNLRAAFAWCAEEFAVSSGLLEQALRVAGELYPYWHLRGRYSEARLWLGRLLAAPHATASAGRAFALLTSASLAAETGERDTALGQTAGSLAIALQLGDKAMLAHALRTSGALDNSLSAPDAALPATSSAQLAEALRLAREVGDRDSEGLTQLVLGFRLLRDGDHEGAGPLFASALRSAEERGDRWVGGMALTGQAEATWFSGNPQAAMPIARRSLEQHEAVGDQHGVGHVLGLLADLAQATGDWPEADAYYMRSLMTLREIGEVPRNVRTLWGLATLAVAQGDAERALVLAAAATALSQQSLVTAYSAADTRLEELWQLAQRTLTPDRQATAWATGQAMSLQFAVAFALRERSGP